MNYFFSYDGVKKLLKNTDMKNYSIKEQFENCKNDFPTLVLRMCAWVLKLFFNFKVFF